MIRSSKLRRLHIYLYLLLFVLFGFLGLGLSLDSQAAKLSGKVKVEGQNDHSNIEVFLGKTGFRAVTNFDGSFSISDVPAGTYTIYAGGLGTLISSQDIAVSGTFETELELKVIPGDFNADGTIDIFDLVILSETWGLKDRAAGWKKFVDISSDGKIDLDDLKILIKNWNQVGTKAGNIAGDVAPTVTPAIVGIYKRGVRIAYVKAGRNDGKFAIYGLPEGEYDLVAEADRYNPDVRKVEVKTATTTFVSGLELGSGALSEFFPPNVKSSVPIEQIRRGGPPKDGIPALTYPARLPRSEGDKYLKAEDAVLGVELNGESVAYPIRILNWHEIVNDSVGGKPIVVTFCPLCGTGMLFDAELAELDGIARTFGVSGLLYNSDLLMYDRQTKTPSLWSQILGEAVVGPLSGKKLKLLPVTQTTWGEWKKFHPETQVLDFKTGYSRDYNFNPYEGYDKNPFLFFPIASKDARLPPKEWIFGVVHKDLKKAYPLEKLKEKGVMNDSIGDLNLVIIADSESGAIRAYERKELKFEKALEGIIDSNQIRWLIAEEALINEETRETLSRLAGVMSFWFGWAAFYKDTLLYGAE